MERNIFRKRSIDRINSPDEINDYIQVTPKAVWAVLIALVVFLTGLLTWGFFGIITYEATAVAEVKDGVLSAWVLEEFADDVKVGQKIKVSDQVVEIRSIDKTLKNLRSDVKEIDWDAMDTLYSKDGGVRIADMFYFTVTANAETIPDGKYLVSVVLENIRPIDFLLKGESHA